MFYNRSAGKGEEMFEGIKAPKASRPSRPDYCDHSSDPLRFIKFEDSALAKCAALGSAIGIPFDFVKGSIHSLWHSCSDPRELEKLVLSGVNEVVLPKEELVARLKSYFHQPVDPVELIRVGLLEERPNGYRVRGMSRQLGVIQARLEYRAKSTAGGKASAEARRKKHGTAQPQGRWPSGEHSESIRKDVGMLSERFANHSENPPILPVSENTQVIDDPAKQPISPRPSEVEVRGKRLEVFKNNSATAERNGEPRKETAKPSESESESVKAFVEQARPSKAEKPALTKKAVATNHRLATLVATLASVYEATRGEPYLHGGAKDTEGLKALLPVASDDAIVRRWEAGLLAPCDQWASCSTFSELKRKWTTLAAPSKARLDPNEGMIRSGGPAEVDNWEPPSPRPYEDSEPTRYPPPADLAGP